MMKRDVRRFQMLSVMFLVCGAMGDPLRAQCEPTWQPLVSGGQIGVAGEVFALSVWNEDLVVGGGFSTAGGQTVNSIARWDGSSWHAFTMNDVAGVNFAVRSLCVWNGDLVVGGDFTTAGGQVVNRIARWDGTAWHPFTMGNINGMNGSVRALVVWKGDLIAGGQFTEAGGQKVNGIARWDGTAWQPFTSGGQIGVGGAISPTVRAFTIWNDNLVAGGTYNTAGGQIVNHIARWDGSAWHALANGISPDGSVFAQTEWSGDLIVGGYFNEIDKVTFRHIARWDGKSWHPFLCANGLPIFVGMSVASLDTFDGDLVAGGDFVVGCGQVVSRVAKWNGAVWHPFSSGVMGDVYSIVGWNDNLVIGGFFSTAGGKLASSISRWGCVAPVAGDINADSMVNVLDLVEVINNWGVCGDPNNCPADVAPPGPPQGDDQVDVQDLLFVINNWG